MSGSRPKTFLSGAGLVWRWQRLVWWIFAVTLIFGFLSTQGMVDRAAGTLNHSFASKRLVDGWDVSAVTELMQLRIRPSNSRVLRSYISRWSSRSLCCF